MVDTRHEHFASSKEPQAFRIRRPSNRESVIYSKSSVLQECSPLTKFEFRRRREHFQEPTSWLERSELSSKTFNAHDFLQRSLLHRHDRSGTKIPHLPMLDSSVDADAALATLDTVETTLRTHRDQSVCEELSARDKLKQALHASSKKREELTTTAKKVCANVTTFGGAGKQAVKALQEGNLSLNTLLSSLLLLVDARDLVALLTDQASELDAVHGSKLLAKASKILEGSQIKDHLTTDELENAKSEIHSCQGDLVESIFDWMREALDTANSITVRDCALAASELDVYDRFVHEYISYVVSTDVETTPDERCPADIDQVFQFFKATCSDTISVFRGIISNIVDIFVDPSMPLSIFIRSITETKVNSEAMKIFSETEGRIKNDAIETKLEVGESQNNMKKEAHSKSCKTLFPSLESCRASLTTLSEDDGEVQRDELMEKKKHLVVSADVFREMVKYKLDIRNTCRDLGQVVAKSVFSALEDSQADFFNREIRRYLELEKKWIDDQLAVAFISISQMESIMPNLVPTKQSDPKMFHQYVSFYDEATANFKDITLTVIEFTYESICRLSDVVLSRSQGTQEEIYENCLRPEKFSGKDFLMQCSKPDVDLTSTVLDSSESWPELQAEQPKRVSDEENDDGSFGEIPMRGKLVVDVRNVIHEMLRGMMVMYLANAETVLQAAAPLLPVCKEDAVNEQLWTMSSSPLTAYTMAVENLVQANELMADFLLNLKSSETHVLDSSEFIEPQVATCHLVSQETRDVLHAELVGSLNELGAEAQQGVKAAISAMHLRVSAILFAPEATQPYTSTNDHVQALYDGFEGRQEPLDVVKPKPSKAFIEVCEFLDHQIHFIVKNIKSCNRDFILAEVASLTRDSIMKCWCCSPGHISLSGAMQMIADSRMVFKPFQKHGIPVQTLRCLPSLAQLFLESPDGLWACIEGSALVDVDARILVGLLKKRIDFGSREIVKICQSLGASEEELLTGL